MFQGVYIIFLQKLRKIEQMLLLNVSEVFNERFMDTLTLQTYIPSIKN